MWGTRLLQQIRPSECVTRVMSDVKNVDPLLRLVDQVDYAIDVRFSSEEELAKLRVFGCPGISMRQLAEALGCGYLPFHSLNWGVWLVFIGIDGFFFPSVDQRSRIFRLSRFEVGF